MVTRNILGDPLASENGPCAGHSAGPMDIAFFAHGLAFLALLGIMTAYIRKWYKVLEEQVKRERKGRT